jgi:phosphatidate cytidylyltransferase
MVGFFAGWKFGKHRVVPSFCPNKTFEGYLGAAIWLVVLEIIILILHHIPILRLTFSLVMVYILATTGDLLVSYQKRILNVKDSGSLIPGHGGFLDRFDSWILVVPFVYFIVK